jgi:hypothetical protein
MLMDRPRATDRAPLTPTSNQVPHSPQGFSVPPSTEGRQGLLPREFYKGDKEVLRGGQSLRSRT